MPDLHIVIDGTRAWCGTLGQPAELAPFEFRPTSVGDFVGGIVANLPGGPAAFDAAYDAAAAGRPCRLFVEARGANAAEVHDWCWQGLQLSQTGLPEPVSTEHFGLVRLVSPRPGHAPVAARVLILVGALDQPAGCRIAEPDVLDALERLPGGLHVEIAASRTFLDRCHARGLAPKFRAEHVLDGGDVELPKADILCYVGHGHDRMRLAGPHPVGGLDGTAAAELLAGMSVKFCMLLACSMRAAFVHPLLRVVDHVVALRPRVDSSRASMAMLDALTEIHRTNSMDRILRRIHAAVQHQEGPEAVEYWSCRTDAALYPAEVLVDDVRYRNVAPEPAGMFYIAQRAVDAGQWWARDTARIPYDHLAVPAGFVRDIPTASEWRAAFAFGAFQPDGSKKEPCREPTVSTEFVYHRVRHGACTAVPYQNPSAESSAVRFVLRPASPYP